MWLGQVWTAGSVGNNGNMAPPQPSRPTDQHKTLTAEKRNNTFNRNLGHFRRRLLLIPALLWVCCAEVLLGNVHRKSHGGVCRRDAVHDGGQGAHAALLRGVGSTQKICKHTQQHVEHKLTQPPAWRARVPSALTLAAVALHALLRGAAPLWAAAAGAA